MYIFIRKLLYFRSGATIVLHKKFNEYILIKKFIVNNIFYFLKRTSSKLVEHTVLRYELYKAIF